jgi:PAS domain S-box-containing protein
LRSNRDESGDLAQEVSVVAQLIVKRKDSLFRKVAMLFAFFLGFRGATQLLAIWTIWNPGYQLGGMVRAVTVLLSVTTAIVLIWLLPLLHRLPSASDLEKEIEERRRAEEAAREKEERFRNFVDSVQDYAMYMIDALGIVQSWNTGAERIKGYVADEIVGRHFSCFYASEDIAAHRPEMTLRIAAEEGRFEGEGWRVRKDGSRFWANVILRPLRDSAGNLTGFSKVTRDLTISRAMEAKYEILLEAAPDAILIVGRQGRILFANRRVEDLFGYMRTEVLGKSVDALVPVRFRGTHGAHRHSFFNAPRNREMGAGRELWGLRKDGTEFAVEISLSPLETADGPVALAAVRDVTERKKAETRFRALLDSAPDAMVIVNSDGFIELANAQSEKLFGYPRFELIGQSVEILVPESLRGTHGEHLQGYFRNPRARAMGEGLDLMALRKDGTQFPVEISLSPLDGPDGTSVTAAIRDVTERKLAARQLAENMQELRHSNESLEQFAHIASHDLQEPLRMVASYTQLLSRRYKGRLDAEADEFIAYAVDGTQRMKQLIEDLLLYSRAGKGAPPMAKFHVGDALREALRNLHAAVEESGAEITADPLPELVAIEPQVVQILQNLIGNAIKYRGSRVPKIHVSAQQGGHEAGGPELIFSVADNGIGIDSRYFDRIFQIFQRLHGRQEYKGTGIGLAICKRILQQQGGRIWVESEPEQGSTFHFSLPLR